jgi:hypothetical protein
MTFGKLNWVAALCLDEGEQAGVDDGCFRGRKISTPSLVLIVAIAKSPERDRHRRQSIDVAGRVLNEWQLLCLFVAGPIGKRQNESAPDHTALKDITNVQVTCRSH